MSPAPLVQFTDIVKRELPPEALEQVRKDLPQVFAEPPPDTILVSRCYAGYSATSRDRIILGVEVQYPKECRPYVVKLGTPEKVGDDAGRWARCTAGRGVASRIFVPPGQKEFGGRVAVVYPDAYILFGPNPEESRPQLLEDVVQRAVKTGDPDPVSVERALAHIYTDLGQWFYAQAQPDKARALTFYRERLRRALAGWVGDPAPHADLLRRALGREATHEPGQRERARHRQALRRDAIWLLCGRDLADDKGDPRYLDPWEYVAWALANDEVPETLVGRAHGDLHGRNALLGEQRGEAGYPAAFDYGEMSPDNVLAWDFVKLETELKVPLLAGLCRQEPARAALWKGDEAWRARPPADGEAAEVARRADRLEAAYRFEARLAEATAAIYQKSDAEELRPQGCTHRPFGDDRLDRLLAVVLRIRKEAALWLGYEHKPPRPFDWQEEYYFALAAYGLSTAKYGYQDPQTECALVSAGVAAARLRTARDVIREMVAEARTGEDFYPSYRAPLAIAHGQWKKCDFRPALAFLKRVRGRHEQAVPLQQEYALLLAEEGRPDEAKELLAPYRELSRVFGDHETLSRIGGSYKKGGDRRWEDAGSTLEQMRESLAGRMYGEALAAYEEAFELRRHYYPGGNAATLALLLGETDRAQRNAREVLAACRLLRDDDLPADERFWRLMSEGEAWLVLRNAAEAAGRYKEGLALLDLGRVKMAQSAYDQLCRLWHPLGSAVLDPVLKVFRGSPLAPLLDPGPVGDCGRGSSPGKSGGVS